MVLTSSSVKSQLNLISSILQELDEEKKFFGGTDYKEVKRYAYNLTSAKKRFKNEVARKTWRNGRYTKQDATREIDVFEKELQAEWNEKIKLLLRYV